MWWWVQEKEALGNCAVDDMARHQTTNQSLYMEWQTRLYTTVYVMCTESSVKVYFISIVFACKWVD